MPAQEQSRGGQRPSVESGAIPVTQMASEIKALTTAERESLLQNAQLPIVIPTDHALAMKADLGIPWNKLRILRRLHSLYNQYLNKAHQVPVRGSSDSWPRTLSETALNLLLKRELSLSR